MPMVGVVDPSIDSAPGELPRWLTKDDLLATAHRAVPSWSAWPFELIYAALAEHQERDYLSATAVTGACYRGMVLERRENYIGFLEDQYASLRGTLLHKVFEDSARPNSMAEWRFFTTVEGIAVSCSPDQVTESPNQILDWKMTENPPTWDSPWKSHTAQVNINRFILNHAEHWESAYGEPGVPLTFDVRRTKFEHLALVYLGPKGPKVIECTKMQPYVLKSGKDGKRKLPYVWTDEEVLEYMVPRLKSLQTALDSYPEWPAGLELEDGWAGPAGWRCPGKPICNLPNCLAKRYPDTLMWANPGGK